MNKVVTPHELEETTRSVVAALTSCTREVLAAQKGLFETWLNGSPQHGIDTSVDVFADLFADPVTLDAIAQCQPRG